jgi:hypothetical protein
MAASNINAETLLDISWNFGSGGVGVNYTPKNDGSMELSVSVLNLIIEEKNKNIGFEFTPVKCWFFYELQDEPEIKHDGIKYSFLNTKMYWNLLDKPGFILGPFAAVNYMYISALNGFTPNEYSFSLGLNFSLRYKIKSYSLQGGAEAGYRNITGKNNIYFLINFDIVPAFTGIMMGMAQEQRDRIESGNQL